MSTKIQARRNLYPQGTEAEYLIGLETVENRQAWSAGKFSTFDGVVVRTNKQEIFVGIENQEQCCEVFGYVVSPPDEHLPKFMNAQLIGIDVTDETGHKEALKNVLQDEDHTLSAMFVDLVTSVGVIQLIVYNSHNGYYGHPAVLFSLKKREERIL